MHKRIAGDTDHLCPSAQITSLSKFTTEPPCVRCDLLAEDGIFDVLLRDRHAERRTRSAHAANCGSSTDSVSSRDRDSIATADSGSFASLLDGKTRPQPHEKHASGLSSPTAYVKPVGWIVTNASSHSRAND
jgi:hypothetical protein